MNISYHPVDRPTHAEIVLEDKKTMVRVAVKDYCFHFHTGLKGGGKVAVSSCFMNVQQHANILRARDNWDKETDETVWEGDVLTPELRKYLDAVTQYYCLSYEQPLPPS